MKHAFNATLIAGLIGLLSSTSAQATAVAGQGTWETTLQARDLNADGVADAYYDTTAKVTWLADANLIKTSQYQFPYRWHPELDPQPDGRASWFLVEEWLQLAGVDPNGGTQGLMSHLEIDGTTGWRLPKVISDSSCRTDWAGFVFCEDHVRNGSSELQNMVKTTLGNSNGLTNTGPFQNLQSGRYWTGTQSHQRDYPFWVYDISSNSHDGQGQGTYSLAFAWVLHDGDIGTALAVPEPGTYALFICGLAALGVRSRRAAKQRR